MVKHEAAIPVNYSKIDAAQIWNLLSPLLMVDVWSQVSTERDRERGGRKGEELYS
jgi:hypothetical protein